MKEKKSKTLTTNKMCLNKRENFDSTKQNEREKERERDQSKEILSEFINYISERERVFFF